MSFVTDVTGGLCPKCKVRLTAGDLVKFNIFDELCHDTCALSGDAESEPGPGAETLVGWDVKMESKERSALAELEEHRVAPLQRPVCEKCRIELPVSMVCGIC